LGKWGVSALLVIVGIRHEVSYGRMRLHEGVIRARMRGIFVSALVVDVLIRPARALRTCACNTTEGWSV
jgi:hypothetical protein